MICRWNHPPDRLRRIGAAHWIRALRPAHTVIPRRPTAGCRRATLDAAHGVRFGVYVHVPFCDTRCGYCDFNTYTASELGPGVSRGAYADTLLHEIRLAADVLGDGDALGERIPPVSTIFFGGGTPTLLPAEHLGLVIREIARAVRPRARRRGHHRGQPRDGDAGLLRASCARRGSTGSRSACSPRCRACSRYSTVSTARAGPEQAVAEARAAGFEHVNLDLIYGAPYETDADWQRSLDAAVGAGPDHVSAYALVVEKGTALARQVAAGVVPAPGRRRARRPLRDGRRDAAGRGVRLVRGVELGDVPTRRGAGTTSCTGPTTNWWGLGPGAHSHVSGVRWWNVKHPVRYAATARGRPQPGGRAARRSTRQARYTERVMLGVRLPRGPADRRAARRRPGRGAPARQLGTDRAARGRRRDGWCSPSAAGCWPTPSCANCSVSPARLRTAAAHPGASCRASRSRSRTCSVCRFCRAARSARCRPSSR